MGYQCHYLTSIYFVRAITTWWVIKLVSFFNVGSSLFTMVIRLLPICTFLFVFHCDPIIRAHKLVFRAFITKYEHCGSLSQQHNIWLSVLYLKQNTRFPDQFILSSFRFVSFPYYIRIIIKRVFHFKYVNCCRCTHYTHLTFRPSSQSIRMEL